MAGFQWKKVIHGFSVINLFLKILHLLIKATIKDQLQCYYLVSFKNGPGAINPGCNRFFNVRSFRNYQ